MSKLVVLSLIILLSTCIVGCNINTEDKEVKDNVNEYGICMKVINGDEDHSHSIGEKASLNEEKNLSVSVLGMREVQTNVMGEEVQDVYAIDIEVENNTNELIEFGWPNFKVKDSSGRDAEVDIMSESNGSLLNTEVLANSKTRGELVYQVSKGSSPSELIVDFNLDIYTIIDLTK